MTGLVSLASSGFSATISPRGAELQSLVDTDGHDLLWDGDPRFWKGRAPILFPVIGTVHDGGYRLDGHHYDMPKHGFARDSLFFFFAFRDENCCNAHKKEPYAELADAYGDDSLSLAAAAVPLWRF